MTNKNLPAAKESVEIVDNVMTKVAHFQKNRTLDLPPHYSASNALRSAMLILHETVDKNKQPALSVCTKASIANALLDMVIQGLNPAKAQAYFIVRGNKLCLDRSYFGTKAVALRVAPDLDDIFAEVIYKGDELEFRIEKGRRIIEKHIQKFTNINNADIAGAYAVAVGKDGEVVRSELMTMDQLKQAWKQSPMHPVLDNGDLKPGSTHAKFTDEMSKKTVTSRLAKHFINASNDSDLVIASVKRTDEHAVEAEAEAEVDEFGNQGEIIDINGHSKNDSEQTENAEPETIDIDPGNDGQEPEKADEAQADNTPSEKEQLEIHAREMSEAGTAYTPTNQEKVNDQGMDSDHAAGRGPGF